MDGKNSNSQIFFGFFEGLTFPFIALLIFQLLSIPTIIEGLLKLPSSSALASTQNFVNLSIEGGILLISFAVFVVQPFMTGLTSVKSAFGYIIGAIIALCLFVTQISTVFPEIQTKLIEDLLLVGLGISVKIIWVIYKATYRSEEENKW